MALYRLLDYQTSFKSIGLLVQEKNFKIDLHDGGHGGHFWSHIKMFVTIFDLQVTLILPMKFQVN